MDFFTPEILSAAMFFASFYGLITCRNVVKSIILIGIMEIAVIMFLLSIGFIEGMKPPIGELPQSTFENVSDPLPQALLLTAIIIGIAVTAVNVVFFISLCRQYKSTDWDTLKKKHME